MNGRFLIVEAAEFRRVPALNENPGVYIIEICVSKWWLPSIIMITGQYEACRCSTTKTCLTEFCPV